MEENYLHLGSNSTSTQAPVASWEIYLFIGFECLLFILTAWLVILVIIYIKTINKRHWDPYIIWSFVMLALAVSDRLVV